MDIHAKIYHRNIGKYWDAERELQNDENREHEMDKSGDCGYMIHEHFKKFHTQLQRHFGMRDSFRQMEQFILGNQVHGPEENIFMCRKCGHHGFDCICKMTHTCPTCNVDKLVVKYDPPEFTEMGTVEHWELECGHHDMNVEVNMADYV